MVTSIDDINTATLGEIFSYCSPTELNNSIPVVSKSFHSTCVERKKVHLSHLSKSNNTFVQMIDLKSAAGQLLNGKVGEVVSEETTSTNHNQHQEGRRFRVQLIHDITGEETKLSVRYCNLNIYVPKFLIEQKQKALKSVNYTNDSKIREAHGMLLGNCLSLSRWFCNQINGYAYYPNNYNEFMALPNIHPALAAASSTMFTFWDTPPNQTGRHGDLSILDMNVISLIQNETQIVQTLGRNTRWPADGANGELIVRNYVRFLKSWSEERITGEFIVTNIFKTGTIMINITKKGELGPVYLVKGQASVIGELFPHGLPAQCFTTILPVYDFLVYDGVCIGVNQEMTRNNPSLLSKLRDHVKNALDHHMVITRGKSSAQGLWRSDPPLLPVIADDGQSLDWSNTGYKTGNDDTSGGPNGDNMEVVQFSEKEKKLAMKIAKLTKRKGILKSKALGHCVRLDNILTFRRDGYTKEENPNRMCFLLFNQGPLNIFHFSDELTYNMSEVLDQLLLVVKNMAMPPMIMLDEKSLVKSLDDILNESLKVVGANEVKFAYYPPPSEEETRFSQMTM